MVTALIVPPNQHPQITQLCDDRTFLDLSVSRGTDFMCSAIATSLEKGIAIIYAQEGALLCLPGNRSVGNRIFIRSSFIPSLLRKIIFGFSFTIFLYILYRISGPENAVELKKKTESFSLPVSSYLLG